MSTINTGRRSERGRHRQGPLPIRHRQGWAEWQDKAPERPYISLVAPKPEELERQEALAPFVGLRNALIAIVASWTVVLGAIALVIEVLR